MRTRLESDANDSRNTQGGRYNSLALFNNTLESGGLVRRGGGLGDTEDSSVCATEGEGRTTGDATKSNHKSRSLSTHADNFCPLPGEWVHRFVC